MTVTVSAAAKLTLGLRITGVRADGYHLIDAEMVSIALHDELTIDESGDGLEVRGPFANGVPTDTSNLVAQALRLAERRAHVTIHKQIPNGGGLGGGSSDAAAVLRWAEFDDVAAASGLGADIPFCMVGGRARVRGIGEVVDALPHVVRTVTLVIPPLQISTPEAYRAWDELGGPTADGPNDLEPAALRVEPRLRRWREMIGEASGTTPVLAGSGATWFVYGEHSNALAALGNEGAEIVTTHTVPAPAIRSGASGDGNANGKAAAGCD